MNQLRKVPHGNPHSHVSQRGEEVLLLSVYHEKTVIIVYAYGM